MTKFTVLFAAVCSLKAQSVNVTYTHQPLAVFKAAIGAQLDHVGLYSATACNDSMQAYKLDEGQLIAHAGKFGVIDPALNLSVIDMSKRRTKKYILFRALDYAGFAATIAAGRDGGKDFKTVSLLLSGVFGRVADAVDRNKGVSPELIQALAHPSRAVTLEPSACTSRLMFGEYRTSFQPYTIQLR